MGKAIIINRLFTGKYIQYNIGHEAINLFKADNGSYYVYVTDDGKIGKERYYKDEKDKKKYDKERCMVEYVLLTRTLEKANAVEVIGLAQGLVSIYDPNLDDNEQKAFQTKYAIEKKVQYGGVNINEIYSGSEQQNVNITFKAELIRKVADGRRIYLKMGKKKNQGKVTLDDRDKKVVIEELMDPKMTHELKNYIDDTRNKNDYEVLEKLIENKELWGDPMPKVSESSQELELCYLDVCKRAYDELAYSNAMLYFAQKYPELAFAFFDKLTGKKNEHETFTALREEKHIDLLFYNRKRIVVVENKVKSGINGICKDENGEINSQLTRYVEAVKNIKKKDEFKNAEEYYFFLAPNYMPVDTDLLTFSYGEEVIDYKLIYYKDVYDFLMGWRENVYGNDPLFNQFVKSLKRHTNDFDDGLFETTIVRFLERIQYIQRKKLYT